MTVPRQQSALSPRMRALAESGIPAVDKFWAEVAAVGTPLVEPDPDDSASRIVTFLFREDSTEIERVVLLGLSYRVCFDTDSLTRIAGTDVWFSSRRLRADVRAPYVFAVNPKTEADGESWWSVYSVSDTRADSYSAGWTTPINSADPRSARHHFSVVELDAARADHWHQRSSRVPRGTMSQVKFTSEILRNTRRLWTYVPPEFDQRGVKYPVLVMLDGWEWAEHVDVAPVLDNLIAAGRIPPVVAVLSESLDRETRRQEYGIQDPVVEYLADELVPWMGHHYNTTDDPHRTVLIGQSAGGLTAAYAALRRPEVFGNVLSQSGAFWRDAGPEFVIEERILQLYDSADRAPVAFYLEAGLLEDEALMLLPNRRFAEMLASRGYEILYREFHGSHHYASWRSGLADGLSYLTKRWNSVA